MDPEGGAAAHMLQRGCAIAPLQSFSNYGPFALPSRKLSQLRNAEYRRKSCGGRPPAVEQWRPIDGISPD